MALPEEELQQLVEDTPNLTESEVASIQNGLATNTFECSECSGPKTTLTVATWISWVDQMDEGNIQQYNSAQLIGTVSQGDPGT